jgi:hypothetical protein
VHFRIVFISSLFQLLQRLHVIGTEVLLNISSIYPREFRGILKWSMTSSFRILKSFSHSPYLPKLMNLYKKVKLFLQVAVMAHRVVRRRGAHRFLDNRLTDDGEVVSLMRRAPFTPGKIPGNHFCQRVSRPQGHSAAGRITSIENQIISSGIETATFRLVAYCLNEQHYRVPPHDAMSFSIETAQFHNKSQ